MPASMFNVYVKILPPAQFSNSKTKLNLFKVKDTRKNSKFWLVFKIL